MSQLVFPRGASGLLGQQPTLQMAVFGVTLRHLNATASSWVVGAHTLVIRAGVRNAPTNSHLPVQLFSSGSTELGCPSGKVSQSVQLDSRRMSTKTSVFFYE